MTNELVRKNIRMSPKIAKWYEDKAAELGVSQANLMVMALHEYIKQDQVVDVVDMFKKLEEANETQK